MVEPHTPTSFKDLKTSGTASSVDDEVAKTRELFGEIKQPLHKLNVHTPLFHSSIRYSNCLIGCI